MRILFFCLVFYVCSAFGQDKVYYLNGTSKECKVLEITPELIYIKTSESSEYLYRSQLLLIQFKNGSTEIINTPTQSVVYNPAATLKPSDNNSGSNPLLHKAGNLSINTLAPCNADIAVFYEHITKSKMFGLGIMGAYNFNIHATLPNQFIAALPHAKKNYDAGLTFNFYPGRFENRTTLYIGAMIKYTQFNFDMEKDSLGITSVSYDHKGSQLATLLTLGTHTYFNEHFFLKTMAGLGAFRLRDNYQTEFNLQSNRNSTGKMHHYTYLPKIYIGINLGFSF
ncbi:MAG: hypothetical protein JWO32_3034 [Bacteroidetes bacterium]|nr:hypothetical protein [Bacteroidota bacterium]